MDRCPHQGKVETRVFSYDDLTLAHEVSVERADFFRFVYLS